MSHLQAYGDVDARVHIYTAMALGVCRVASPTFGRLCSRGMPRYSFYKRLSIPQDQSGHERVKNNFLTDFRNNQFDMGTKGDRDFWISDLVKSPDGTDI